MEMRATVNGRTREGMNEWSPGSFSLRMEALGRARCKDGCRDPFFSTRQLGLNFNNGQVSALLAPASCSGKVDLGSG